jgi:hypothetical protein
MVHLDPIVCCKPAGPRYSPNLVVTVVEGERACRAVLCCAVLGARDACLLMQQARGTHHPQTQCPQPP